MLPISGNICPAADQSTIRHSNIQQSSPVTGPLYTQNAIIVSSNTIETTSSFNDNNQLTQTIINDECTTTSSEDSGGTDDTVHDEDDEDDDEHVPEPQMNDSSVSYYLKEENSETNPSLKHVTGNGDSMQSCTSFQVLSSAATNIVLEPNASRQIQNKPIKIENPLKASSTTPTSYHSLGLTDLTNSEKSLGTVDSNSSPTSSCQVMTASLPLSAVSVSSVQVSFPSQHPSQLSSETTAYISHSNSLLPYKNTSGSSEFPISPKAPKKRRIAGHTESPSESGPAIAGKLVKHTSVSSGKNNSILPLAAVHPSTTSGPSVSDTLNLANAGLGDVIPPVCPSDHLSFQSWLNPEINSSSSLSLVTQLCRRASKRAADIEQLNRFVRSQTNNNPEENDNSTASNAVPAPCNVAQLHLLRVSEVSEREMRLLTLQQHCFRLLKNIYVCFPGWGTHEGSYLWHAAFILGATSVRDVSSYSLVFEDVANEITQRLREAQMNIADTHRNCVGPGKLTSAAIAMKSKPQGVHCNTRNDRNLLYTTSGGETQDVDTSSSDTASSFRPPAEISGSLLTALMFQVDSPAMVQCLLLLDNHRQRSDSIFKPLTNFQEVVTSFVAAQALHAIHQPPVNYLLGTLNRFRSTADISAATGLGRGNKRRAAVVAMLSGPTSSTTQTGNIYNTGKARTKKQTSGKLGITAETDSQSAPIEGTVNCSRQQQPSTPKNRNGRSDGLHQSDNFLRTPTNEDEESVTSTSENSSLIPAIIDKKGIDRSQWASPRLLPSYDHAPQKSSTDFTNLIANSSKEDDSDESDDHSSIDALGSGTQQSIHHNCSGTTVFNNRSSGLQLSLKNNCQSDITHSSGVFHPSDLSGSSTLYSDSNASVSNSYPIVTTGTPALAISSSVPPLKRTHSFMIGGGQSEGQHSGKRPSLGQFPLTNLNGHPSTNSTVSHHNNNVSPQIAAVPSPSHGSSPQPSNGLPLDGFELPRDPEAFRSQVKGVYYDDTSNRWCASWHERKTGKKKSRYFAVKKFGFTTAKTHAMEARLEAEESGECAPTNIN